MLTTTTFRPEKKSSEPGTVCNIGARDVVSQIIRNEKRTLLHAPLAIITTIQEVATRLECLDLDVVITSAIWAFCRQDPATRHLIVSKFWFRDLPKLEAAMAVRHTKTLKEKLHALVANCCPVFRHRSVH
jgi:hypothetical protein